MLRTVAAWLAEVLCPVIIALLILDATRFVGWRVYAGRDAAIYATVARFWEDGLLPYRDVYDFKPPLIYVALRVGFAAWDYHPESLRRVFLLVTGVGALLLYLGLRRDGAAVAAPIAALGLLTLIVPALTTLTLQNTEVLVAAFAASACGCAAAAPRSAGRFWVAGAGAWVGLAALSKQPGIVFCVPVAVQLCMVPASPSPLRHAVQNILLASAACASVIAAACLYFAMHGALAAAYEAVITGGSSYVNVGVENVVDPRWWVHLARARGVGIFANWGVQTMVWVFVGGLLALVPATLLRPSRWCLTAWVWIAATYVAIIAGPLGDLHYMVMAYPALALTLGIVFQSAFADEPSIPRKHLLWAVLVAMILYGNVWWVSDLSRLPSEPPAPEAAEIIGTRIRAAAQAGDTLLVEGEPYSIYVYAGVRPASRFIYWNAPHPQAQDAFRNALQSHPRFVVMTPESADRIRKLRTDHSLHTDPIAQVLSEAYEEWFDLPLGGTVYRRTEPDTRPPVSVGEPQ